MASTAAETARCALSGGYASMWLIDWPVAAARDASMSSSESHSASRPSASAVPPGPEMPMWIVHAAEMEGIELTMERTTIPPTRQPSAAHAYAGADHACRREHAHGRRRPSVSSAWHTRARPPKKAECTSSVTPRRLPKGTRKKRAKSHSEVVRTPMTPPATRRKIERYETPTSAACGARRLGGAKWPSGASVCSTYASAPTTTASTIQKIESSSPKAVAPPGAALGVYVPRSIATSRAGHSGRSLDEAGAEEGGGGGGAASASASARPRSAANGALGGTGGKPPTSAVVPFASSAPIDPHSTPTPSAEAKRPSGGGARARSMIACVFSSDANVNDASNPGVSESAAGSSSSSAPPKHPRIADRRCQSARCVRCSSARRSELDASLVLSAISAVSAPSAPCSTSTTSAGM